MHSTDWLQFALFLGLLTLITKPLGLYLMQVLDANDRTWLDPMLRPLEKISYKQLEYRSVTLEEFDIDAAQQQWAQLVLELIDSSVDAYTTLNMQQIDRLEVVQLAEAKKGFALLPRRWVVECSFGWAERFRRLARDYERLALSLEGIHWLAFASLILSSLFRQS